jgi:hypothetical protein
MWKSTFDSSIYLIQEILLKLRGTAAEHIGLIAQATELILLCAQKVDMFKDERSMEMWINDVISPAFLDVSSSLKDYVTNTLGGPFGSAWKGFRWSSSQANIEIKVVTA